MGVNNKLYKASYSCTVMYVWVWGCVYECVCCLSGMCLCCVCIWYVSGVCSWICMRTDLHKHHYACMEVSGEPWMCLPHPEAGSHFVVRCYVYQTSSLAKSGDFYIPASHITIEPWITNVHCWEGIFHGFQRFKFGSSCLQAVSLALTAHHFLRKHRECQSCVSNTSFQKSSLLPHPFLRPTLA